MQHRFFSLALCPATPRSSCLDKIAILPTSVSCSHCERQPKIFLVESQELFAGLLQSLALFWPVCCSLTRSLNALVSLRLLTLMDPFRNAKILFFHKLVLYLPAIWSPCLPLALHIPLCFISSQLSPFFFTLPV